MRNGFYLNWFFVRKERLTMRRHARETIRRPRDFETDFEWDIDEKKQQHKDSQKPNGYDLGDDDRYESDEDKDT